MTMSERFFHKVLLVFVLVFVFISAGFSAQDDKPVSLVETKSKFRVYVQVVE